MVARLSTSRKSMKDVVWSNGRPSPIILPYAKKHVDVRLSSIRVKRSEYSPFALYKD
ncbi:MAG: hypothetical protein NVS4B1_32040 [Ktedonobacteraceae bacterium]